MFYTHAHMYTRISTYLAKMSFKMLYLFLRALDLFSTSLCIQDHNKETCMWLEGGGSSLLSFSC